jgi:hypothetical protein
LNIDDLIKRVEENIHFTGLNILFSFWLISLL